MKPDAKLTVVVRADLRPGQQAVQAMHAQRSFIAEHPEQESLWFERSNTLALLAVDDENALVRVLDAADATGIRFSFFREPDLGNSITAVALEPGEQTTKLCRAFPLALRAS